MNISLSAFTRISLICGMVILSNALSANYSGNIAEPDLIGRGVFFGEGCCFGLKMGYLRDSIEDRTLKSKAGLLRGWVDDFKMHSDLGMLTFSYIHRFEIYGSIGSSQISFKTPTILPSTHYRTKNHIAYGLGFRAVLYKCGNTIFGGNLSYFTTHPRLALKPLDPLPRTTRLDYREWQMSIGAAQKLKWVCPYLSLEGGQARGDLNSTPDVLNYKMSLKNNVGAVLGASFVNGDYFDANVELRTISQWAWSFALNAKF